MNERNWLDRTYTALLLLAVTAAAAHAQTFTTLVSFNMTNGADPGSMSLVQGTDGYYYGTAYYGGCCFYGTVFKMTAGGMMSILQEFGCYRCGPQAGLALGADGNFYGVTLAGNITPMGSSSKSPPRESFDKYTRPSRGASNDGTIFEVSPKGSRPSTCTLRNYIASRAMPRLPTARRANPSQRWQLLRNSQLRSIPHARHDLPDHPTRPSRPFTPSPVALTAAIPTPGWFKLPE